MRWEGVDQIKSTMMIGFNPLRALTPQSGWDLNVACSSKRPKAALLYSS
jgi:hypothetical protein